jgi:hypothetical protein
LISKTRLQRSETSQRDQEKTVSELRRSNEILFNISRAQYPLTNNIRITPVLRISTNHPVLKNFADQIKENAERLVTIAKKRSGRGGKPLVQFVYGTGDDEMVVSQMSPLVPQNRLVRSLLTSLVLNVQIFGKGNDLSCECGSDLAFAYTAELFDKKNCCGATLTYRRSDSSFGVVGPMLIPAETGVDSSFNSNGKIISYLDLPGSSLVLSCNDERWQRSEGRLMMSVSHNCDDNISITAPRRLALLMGRKLKFPESFLSELF